MSEEDTKDKVMKELQEMADEFDMTLLQAGIMSFLSVLSDVGGEKLGDTETIKRSVNHVMDAEYTTEEVLEALHNLQEREIIGYNPPEEKTIH